MPDKVIEKSITQDYKYGFETDIEQDTLPPGWMKVLYERYLR